MSHAYNRIWLHVVFATKYREPLISPNVEISIHNHIKEQLTETGCITRIINGMPDHIHILFLLNPQKNVAEVVKQVKGNTTHWINQQSLLPKKFAWQTGYASFSVSESQVNRVQHYIANQKEHHKKNSFNNEFDGLVAKHNLQLHES